MLKKIALEEHCMAPELVSYWEPSVAALPSSLKETITRRLHDYDSERLGIMDQSGVALSILSMAGPGVQIEKDAGVAIRTSQRANDFLAKQVERHPARFRAFAHLPMQDPAAAANELERCVRDLRFCGALINGQTHGVFLDDRRYDVFWERASALNAPVYLHPADPVATFTTLLDYPELTRATWGWTIETASHALRIVFGGVFDRYPQASLILGHMGETLPFMLWRLDSRYQLYRQERPLTHLPSHYIRNNLYITTSGQCSNDALLCSIGALGAGRVMFSIDYPFETTELAGRFMEEVPLDSDARARIASGNAEQLFKLS